jgi:hypothetical protein
VFFLYLQFAFTSLNYALLNSSTLSHGRHATRLRTTLFFFVLLQDLIREADPDIIIGYNICKFDLPYLIEV